MGVLSLICIQNVIAQEEKPKKTTIVFEEEKDKITQQEKELLKKEIEEITKKLENKEITRAQADELKKEAAVKRALNIENRIAIVENKIALLKRNDGKLIENHPDGGAYLAINWGGEDEKGGRLIGVQYGDNANSRGKIYDRRTYSGTVIAVGLNNAIIEGQSLEDSPYRIGGSRFFELGWQWRTRVFKNTNFLRFHYGLSFQFNGLKPKDNQFFVENGDQTELQEFSSELDKSKLRMDNLVFPIHFEFGSSKLKERENSIRYSINNQFRFGIGGYGGFNIGTRQKLKFNQDSDQVKEKLKRDYNTSNLIYGLSAYAGFDGIQLYAKYDLNPIFQNAAIEQRNISLGVRFDFD